MSEIITYYRFLKWHPLHPFCGESPGHSVPGIFPPDDVLLTAPEQREGYWPCEQDGEWIYVEDHRGREGYRWGGRGQ